MSDEVKRNQCKFIGNLTREPETFQFKSGGSKTSFCLAVSNDYKKDDEWVKVPASFFDFVIWNGKGEELAAQATKGQRVNVTNSIASQESWEDKETGAKRSKVVFKVFDFELVDKKEVSNEDSEPPKSTPKRGRPAKKVVEDDDDDIPF